MTIVCRGSHQINRFKELLIVSSSDRGLPMSVVDISAARLIWSPA